MITGVAGVRSAGGRSAKAAGKGLGEPAPPHRPRTVMWRCTMADPDEKRAESNEWLLDPWPGLDPPKDGKEHRTDRIRALVEELEDILERLQGLNTTKGSLSDLTARTSAVQIPEDLDYTPFTALSQTLGNGQTYFTGVYGEINTKLATAIGLIRKNARINDTTEDANEGR